MNFTYKSYEELIEKIRVSGYEFVDYHNWQEKKRPVILRHDIDYSVDKAVELALLEERLGIKSTYFVLLTSDFYNVFSQESYNGLMKILDLNHEIGLHFDETRYENCEKEPEKICELIQNEIKVLESCLGRPITTVSMHRPSKKVLEADLNVPGVVNSYSRLFFDEFKYVSDSRRRWREPIDEIISSKRYEKLHILTHAFWYNDKEIDIYESVKRFVNDGNMSRYRWMSSNITDLDAIMNESEVAKAML